MDGQDNEESINKEEKSDRLKRPSLFIIRGILDNVNRSNNHRARFLQIATCTPELRNRKKMVAYLDLLVEELGWLERDELVETTHWNPFKANPQRKWMVSWYAITAPGKTFLELFPNPRVLPEEEEHLPTPEDQARNWEEWKLLNWRKEG